MATAEHVIKPAFLGKDPIQTEHLIKILRGAAPLFIGGVLLAYQSLRVISGKVTVGGLVQPETLQDISYISPWLFLAIPMIWFVLEIVTMLTNDHRRALHDFIAGTVVVRTNMR